MKKILEYVKDTKFKITIFDNKIDILNYEDIIIFEDNRIVIKTKLYNIVIKGTNLTINKVYDQELLIKGDILNIEFR